MGFMEDLAKSLTDDAYEKWADQQEKAGEDTSREAWQQHLNEEYEKKEW